MALLFLESFDKYGGVNTNSTAVGGLLTAGEWTSLAGTNYNIVAGLSATGYALNCTGNAGVIKTLANSTRLLGGVRFASTLAGIAGVQFYDSGTAQAGIGINTTGTVSVRNGSYASGTVLGTSTVSVTASSVHYLEWDITFANSGSYQIWLDGVSILSGSGDTTATASAFANQVGVGGAASGNVSFDDMYVFDTSGTTNNAILLTSPRVETQFPTGDAAVQFAPGAAIVGESLSRNSGSIAGSANQLRLRAVTPSANCTLNSISIATGIGASGSVNLRPVVYADAAGVPAALLASGSTVTGLTANSTKTMPLTSGLSLIAGTAYWIGYMVDVAVVNGYSSLETALTDRIATSTFASGAPGTAPAMSSAAGSMIWGTVVVTGNNWYAVSRNPAQGNASYNYDATVSHEDLYSFPALSVTPSAIHAVAVKASVTKSDAGAKIMSVRLKSGSTDSAGSGGTSLAPGTSYAWVSSHYPTDPNTSAAWSLSALNAAQAGVKVES